MMFRLLDSIGLALERLWQHRVLVVWAMVGLSAATTLALSLTLYVDAVNSGLLASGLANPPYAYRFRYVGSWEGNITQADVNAATGAVQTQFVQPIGFPTLQNVRYFRGTAWSVQLNKTANLGAFSLGVLEGAEGQIALSAGEWSPETFSGEEGVIPVMLTEKNLYNMGVKVGDTLTAQRTGLPPLTFQVVALWRPMNEADPAWIFPPSFFDSVMLTTPAYLETALTGVEKPIEEVAWYVNFDGSAIQTADVQGILDTTVSGQRSVAAALPGVRMDASPVDGLNAFNREVTQLTQQLVIMVLPVGGLVLYFVSVVAGMLVGRQQDEDVTLRSRGMSRWGVIWLHTLMWLILATAALGVGILLAPMVVQVVGQTTSFLRFDSTTPPLKVIFTQRAILAGMATSLLAASSGLLLSWRSSARTITSHKQAQAREAQAWWQKWYLDMFLMIPAVYVLYTLRQRGGIVSDAENPFADPLTFLGPTLFAMGLTLFFLRVLPFILRLAGQTVALTGSIALLMALRELTRSMGRYRGALLMMCLTLSLTGFMASMASTLDRSLKDSVDYRIGADAVIVTATDAETESNDAQAGQAQTQTVTGFNTLPAADLLQVEGVAAVSRVGRYAARLTVPGQRLDGTLLAVDRGTMAAVTRSRADYASEPMGNIFNRLAGNRTGLLVNTQIAVEYNLLIGQEVEYQVFALNEWYQTKAPIVGVVDYFPTMNPSNGFFLITNMDPVFELVGTPLPHNFWISLKPDADRNAVQTGVRALGYPVLEWQDPDLALQQAQAAPARRGVFGFLSVGFIASIVLTLIVAIIQSAASFRAQSAQLGSLRAMGLSGSTVGLYLLFSQGIAALSGILGGTSIGFITTLLYLPLLDFSGGLPPYLIRVAWDDIITVYVIFAAILFTVIVTMTLLLGRERLSTIVRLGDA